MVKKISSDTAIFKTSYKWKIRGNNTYLLIECNDQPEFPRTDFNIPRPESLQHWSTNLKLWNPLEVIWFRDIQIGTQTYFSGIYNRNQHRQDWEEHSSLNCPATKRVHIQHSVK